MKHILLSLTLFLIGTGIYAQHQHQATSAKSPKEALTLKETSWDFGKIQQGRPVTHEFKIINQGPDILKIDNVQTSCGCTTPVWQKEPVASRQSAKINVGFNAAEAGPFEKTITVFYNGGQKTELIIKGNVYKAPATSAPSNASIQLLKQIN